MSEPHPTALRLSRLVGELTGEQLVDGYVQPGEVDGVVDLPGIRLEITTPARRWHRWGIDAWAWDDLPPPGGERAPVAVGDTVLERVAGPHGWSQSVRRGVTG